MKLRIFNYYALVHNHRTSERSILFYGAYLCRLSFPLCYNFLNMATNEDDTVFSKFMGQMDLVPFLGSNFNDVLPMLILVPVLLTLFDVHVRVQRVFDLNDIFVDEELGDLNRQEGRLVLEDVRRSRSRGYANQFAAPSSRRSRPSWSDSTSVTDPLLATSRSASPSPLKDGLLSNMFSSLYRQWNGTSRASKQSTPPDGSQLGLSIDPRASSSGTSSSVQRRLGNTS